MQEIRTQNLIRINKAVAKKMFNSGQPIYLCPSKLNPENQMMPATPISNKVCGAGFNHYTNMFKHYNCNSETGKDVYYYKHI